MTHASNVPVDRYKDLYSIPDVLLVSVKHEVFFENYVARALQTIRQNRADKGRAVGSQRCLI